jgi:hypothetical protein
VITGDTHGAKEEAQTAELTRNQKDHLALWFSVVVVSEIFLVLFPLASVHLFALFAAGFLGGLALRASGRYPGKLEPLTVDLLSGLLAAVAAVLCLVVPPGPGNLLLRLAAPAAVVAPHIAYVLRDRHVCAVWYRARSS